MEYRYCWARGISASTKASFLRSPQGPTPCSWFCSSQRAAQLPRLWPPLASSDPFCWSSSYLHQVLFRLATQAYYVGRDPQRLSRFDHSRQQVPRRLSRVPSSQALLPPPLSRTPQYPAEILQICSERQLRWKVFEGCLKLV